MNLRLLAEAVLIAGFIFCMFVPFARKRLRARWAKLLFCGIGVVGLVYTFAEITLDKGWFALTQSHTEFLRHQLHFVRGLLLGALLSLLFSGQARGIKRRHDDPAHLTMRWS